MYTLIQKAEFLEMEIQKYKKIPNWTDNVIEWYVSDKVTEHELIIIMEYLVTENMGIVN